MSTEEPPERASRITVSRETLRADLAEMELRLRVYFDAQLSHKANAADLAAVQARVGDLELARQARDRGEFTEAQDRAIDERVRSVTKEARDSSWTSRERVFAACTLAIGLTGLVVSILLALHGVPL